MAAVLLFWDTNMAAVTSYENSLYDVVLFDFNFDTAKKNVPIFYNILSVYSILNSEHTFVHH